MDTLTDGFTPWPDEPPRRMAKVDRACRRAEAGRYPGAITSARISAARTRPGCCVAA
jgi:hypothetical protein